MGIGRSLHDHAKHGDGGGVINHPRAYEVLAEIGFIGRRRRVFAGLAALTEIRPGEKILDVGCGTGYLTHLLAPVTGPAGQVTGVDPSASMVGHAGRHAPRNCSYQVGEGQDLPFPDASFDVLVSTLAVHHMPSSARALAVQEMFRVLRPGGRLLIAEFHPPANRLAAHLMSVLVGPAMRPSMPELLAELVPAAGFQVKDEGRVKPLMYYIKAVRPAA
ncbi:methyltransferase domain-containing protein [Nonomuraea sp. NPDC048916]|uniref:class I SAM-dependent methyltransferase n=1 Tax=Nonomuraea sp. NPDC048916 TaxID=3154232 RepID=UPI0033C10E64